MPWHTRVACRTEQAGTNACTDACKAIAQGSAEGQCMKTAGSSIITHCSWWSFEQKCCLYRTPCSQIHHCSSWQRTLMESESHRMEGGGEDACQHGGLI